MLSKDQLSAGILGQIVLMQSVVSQLPDKTAMLRFACRGLTDISGVAGVRFTLPEVADAVFSPPADINPDEQIFVIERNRHIHAALVFSIDEPTVFTPYIPYVENFTTMLAVIFEERRQQDLNSILMAELENRVLERTRELEHEIEIRKQADEALQLTQLSINAVSESILWLDQDARFQFVNDTACRRLGYSREELLSLAVFDIDSTFPRDAWPAYWSKIVKTRSATLESEHITKSGGRFPVEITATLIEYEGKQYNCAIARDITERRRSIEALSAEKERLSVTLRSIGDGVITTNTNGTVVLMNQVAETLTGWDSETARGKRLTEVFTVINEETRERCENPVARVLASGTGIELADHTVLVARDGTERLISDSGAPIKDEKDNIVGVVLVFRDMTEKRKLLDSLQRTTKLDALGILAGGIAHDFNNLLGGIFGYIDMALEETQDERVFQYLTRSLASIERARALTQQLLTFAKGGEPIRNIAPLFPMVQETAQFALSGSSVKCRCTIPNDLWACDFDRNQIAQVIDNIVINAKQAMPDGGTIQLSAQNLVVEPNDHPSLSAGNYVQLSLRDSGIGIPKEILPRIFDPFYTTKAKGHGLGLATSYSIITRHGGTIEVESEPGTGTVFHLFLPATAKSSPHHPAAQVPTFKGEGTILILDDEDAIRDVLQAMLRSMGFQVAAADTAKKAVDLFIAETAAGRSVVAMIFDLTIPGGPGGKEVIKEIRQFAPITPAFVASGYAADPVMANPSRYGFTASLAKPFRKRELAAMLKKHLTSPAAAAPAETTADPPS